MAVLMGISTRVLLSRNHRTGWMKDECFCLSKVINLGDLFSEPFISRDMTHPLKTSEAQAVP